MPARFLIIDDSELDCYIIQKNIEHLTQDFETVCYREAEKAFNDIKNDLAPSSFKTIIFLDILMPVMDGYKFMDAFEGLDDEIKDKYIILAITSSMYKNQINKIYTYKRIDGVLEKPFTIKKLNKIIEKIYPELLLRK